MTPEVTVSIVHWNAFPLLKRALESLKTHVRGTTYAVTVVDNASSNPPREDFEKSFPEVRFLWNPENTGFSAGNNQAFENSKSPFLLLLNADTRQIEDSITPAIAFLKSNPEIGALGVGHRNDDANLSPQRSWHPFPSWIDDIKGSFGIPLEKKEGEDFMTERDVDWVCGSFLLVRRECWESVGPLDEKFFLYDEDIDWSRRAMEKKWKIHFLPQISIVHVGSAAGRLMNDKTYSNLRSRLRYYTLYGAPGSGFVFYICVLLKLSVGITVALLKGGDGVKHRFRRWMAFLTLKPSKYGV